MNMTRRDMLLASMGLMVSGCAQRAVDVSRHHPSPGWYEPPPAPSEPVAPPHHPQPAPPAAASRDPFQVIPRSRWTRSGPIGRRVKPMNGIRRITVHHEGWTPYWSADARATAGRLEQIRTIHVRDRGWGDIGYHYVIDRAGRVWEGRPLHLQGAHVKNNNPHNLGVMVLGNFDKQSPTKQQIDQLGFALRALMRRYRLPAHRVKTHQEWMPTACPGLHLQPIVARMRSTRYLG